MMKCTSECVRGLLFSHFYTIIGIVSNTNQMAKWFEYDGIGCQRTVAAMKRAYIPMASTAQ